MMYVVGISKLGSVLQVSHDNMSHVTCSHRESSVNLLLNGTVRGSHMSLGLQCLLCEEHISVD